MIPSFGIISPLNSLYFLRINYVSNTGFSLWDTEMNKSLFPFQKVSRVFDKDYSLTLWFKHLHPDSLALFLSFLLFFSFKYLSILLILGWPNNFLVENETSLSFFKNISMCNIFVFCFYDGSKISLAKNIFFIGKLLIPILSAVYIIVQII